MFERSRPAYAGKFPLWPVRFTLVLQESGLAGYEQLYNDSMRRRMKLEALAAQPPEEATFRPRVSPEATAVVPLCLRESRGAGAVQPLHVQIYQRVPPGLAVQFSDFFPDRPPSPGEHQQRGAEEADGGPGGQRGPADRQRRRGRQVGFFS